jgi:Spy/CpxP family protein refolding chaperone
MKKLMVRMLVLLAVPVGLAMAEPSKEGCKTSSCGSGKPVAREGGMGQFLTTKLGLTAEQNEKFQKMLEKHMDAMKAEKERFEAEVNTILTPEQQAKFKGITANREQRMKGPEAGAKKGGGFGQALEELNLPADKLAQVQAIMKESREKQIAVPRGDRAAHQEIRKQMIEKVKSILTPEEMTKFEQLLNEHHPGKGFHGKGK